MNHKQFTPYKLALVADRVERKTEERLAKKGRLVFNSPHEALGIITEEYAELIEAVKSDDKHKVYTELLDIAVAAQLAMASLIGTPPEGLQP